MLITIVLYFNNNHIHSKNIDYFINNDDFLSLAENFLCFTFVLTKQNEVSISFLSPPNHDQ